MRPGQPSRRVLSLRIAVGKFVLTLLGLLCGASIGREGPTVQVGAAIMHASAGCCACRAPALQRALVLAGGAAGCRRRLQHAAGRRRLRHRGAEPLLRVPHLRHRPHRGHPRRHRDARLLGNYTYFGHDRGGAAVRRGWIAVLLCGIAGGIAGGLFSRR